MICLYGGAATKPRFAFQKFFPSDLIAFFNLSPLKRLLNGYE